MLYASTRTSLTKELGDYRFVDSMWGTDPEEFTLKGYKKHKSHQSAEAPLTQRERELAEIKLAESKQASSHTGTTVRNTYAGGVSMPLSSEAETALKELSKSDRPHNYVSLRLDSHESIELDNTATVTADELAKTVPADSPRFTFYAYAGQESDEAAFGTHTMHKRTFTNSFLIGSFIQFLFIPVLHLPNFGKRCCIPAAAMEL